MDDHVTHGPDSWMTTWTSHPNRPPWTTTPFPPAERQDFPVVLRPLEAALQDLLHARREGVAAGAALTSAG